MLPIHSIIWTLSLVLIAVGAPAVFGQDYPNRPLRILASPAGGGADFASRLLAQEISGPLGQPVIVDNRASCFHAGAVLSKALPDGYTLMLCGASTWISTLLQKAPYDVEMDFSPISVVEREVNVLGVYPSLPVKSVKELIALAKAKPGELNYSSGGAGGPPHLGMELFKSMAGINIVQVPYKGAAAALNALIAGEVQVHAGAAGTVAAHVKSGKLRALAVTSAEPSVLAPGLPTVAASGLPGYEVVGVSGIWATIKTPGAVINRLNQEIVRALKKEEVKQKLFSAGAEAVSSSPEEFASVIKSDMARMGKVIKNAGIRVE